MRYLLERASLRCACPGHRACVLCAHTCSGNATLICYALSVRGTNLRSNNKIGWGMTVPPPPPPSSPFYLCQCLLALKVQRARASALHLLLYLRRLCMSCRTIKLGSAMTAAYLLFPSALLSVPPLGILRSMGTRHPVKASAPSMFNIAGCLIWSIGRVWTSLDLAYPSAVRAPRRYNGHHTCAGPADVVCMRTRARASATSATAVRACRSVVLLTCEHVSGAADVSSFHLDNNHQDVIMEHVEAVSGCK